MHTTVPSSKSIPLARIALCMLALSTNPVAAADLDTQKRVLALYEESSGHHVKETRLRDDAESELDNCARVHERYHWWEDVVEACTKAQGKVDECNAFHADWERRRTVVLAEIEKQSPGIGQEYTGKVVSKGEFGTPMLDPRTGKPITETVDAYRLKGQISPLDSEQRWNDFVRGLRNRELRTCPWAVPGVVDRNAGGLGSPLSPAEAMEYWKKKHNKPLSRPTSSAATSMLAAAVEEANDEGVIRDAEEAAAEKERQRLAKIKEEQDRLARIAAEQAAKEQARLLAQQEAEQAREDAEQEREDRAAAKQQAKTASTSSRSSSSGGSGKVSSASSVCGRNFDKLRSMGGPPLPEGDQWGAVQAYVDVNELWAKLWQPCMGYDQTAKEQYDFRMYDYQALQNACSNVSHLNCTQWGTANPQQMMAYYNWWKAEVEKALSDPNYSADQGKMRSGSSGESSTGRAGTTSGKGGDVSGAACRDGLTRLGKEGDAINARRPANADTVPSIQVALHIIGKRMEFMDSSCRGQPEYSEYASLKKAYDQVMITCQQVTSSPDYCVAKVAW